MNDLAERRLEEKERRRAEILDAAQAMAATAGVESMTMDQVARSARLSRALLYVYFRHKDDLLLGICERGLTTLERRFKEAVARHTTGLAQVEACGRAYVAFSHEFPVYFNVLARFEAHEPPSGDDAGNSAACVLAGDRVHDVLVASIERGFADGSIRADVGSPRLVAVTLWAFMHGAIQLASTKAGLLAHDGISVTQLIDNALQLAGRSLAAGH
jgi:AcrR family transcriptional regulator